MAKSRVYGFNEDGYRRVKEATRRVLGTPTVGSQRRRQTPVVGGGGGGCDPQNAIWDITIIGKPTGGTFTLTVTVNAVATTLTFNYNDGSSACKTTLETHSEISSADVSVSGGVWPNATMRIMFTGALANTDIQLPTAAWGSLTGGVGTGIICSLAQKGHA